MCDSCFIIFLAFHNELLCIQFTRPAPLFKTSLAATPHFSKLKKLEQQQYGLLHKGCIIEGKIMHYIIMHDEKVVEYTLLFKSLQAISLSSTLNKGSSLLCTFLLHKQFLFVLSSKSVEYIFFTYYSHKSNANKNVGC